jgi:hypothetical protein
MRFVLWAPKQLEGFDFKEKARVKLGTIFLKHPPTRAFKKIFFWFLFSIGCKTSYTNHRHGCYIHTKNS